MLILKKYTLRYIMKRHEGDFIIIKDSVYQKKYNSYKCVCA